MMDINCRRGVYPQPGEPLIFKSAPTEVEFADPVAEGMLLPVPAEPGHKWKTETLRAGYDWDEPRLRDYVVEGVAHLGSLASRGLTAVSDKFFDISGRLQHRFDRYSAQNNAAWIELGSEALAGSVVVEPLTTIISVLPTDQ